MHEPIFYVRHNDQPLPANVMKNYLDESEYSALEDAETANPLADYFKFNTSMDNHDEQVEYIKGVLSEDIYPFNKLFEIDKSYENPEFIKLVMTQDNVKHFYAALIEIKRFQIDTLRDKIKNNERPFISVTERPDDIKTDKDRLLQLGAKNIHLNDSLLAPMFARINDLEDSPEFFDMVTFFEEYSFRKDEKIEIYIYTPILGDFHW